MQQYPPSDKVDSGTTNGQHQLSYQYQVDEVQVLLLDTYIYNGLCQEGEDQLQQTSHQCAENDLPEITAVSLHVVE